MGGDNSGIDSGKGVTNGGWPWRLFATFAGFLFVVIVVNISSHAMEEPTTPLWEPTLWELSSYAAILILLPGLYYSYQHFHWRSLGLARFTIAQIASFLIFSIVHISLMVAIRRVGYTLAHERYNFSQGHLALELIYESRKDALTYIVAGGFFWVHERLQQQVPRALPDRIEVKNDGRTLYLTPAEIIYAEAAGNYVELHLTGSSKPLLLRGTLGGYEKRLAPYAFARIHRSRLINRAHLRSVTSTPSGDLRITLANGRQLAGSRRFKSALEA